MAGAAKLIITITAAPVRTILLIDFIIFDLLPVSVATHVAYKVNTGAGASKGNRPK
jgi:hypothetical protein